MLFLLAALPLIAVGVRVYNLYTRIKNIYKDIKQKSIIWVFILLLLECNLSCENLKIALFEIKKDLNESKVIKLKNYNKFIERNKYLVRSIQTIINFHDKNEELLRLPNRFSYSQILFFRMETAVGLEILKEEDIQMMIKESTTFPESTRNEVDKKLKDYIDQISIIKYELSINIQLLKNEINRW